MKSELTRDLSVKLCRYPGFRPLGQHIYERAADRMAHAFSSLPGIQSCVLWGGAVGRCEPAVSDLDWLLIAKEEVLRDARWLYALRERYANTKRIYPMLGEVVLLSIEDLQYAQARIPAAFFDRKDRRVYGGISLPGVPPYSSATSRFRFAVLHYLWAWHSVRDGHGMRKTRARLTLQKECAKVIALAENSSIRVRKEPANEDQLWNAYVAMDRLAREARQELSTPPIHVRLWPCQEVSKTEKMLHEHGAQLLGDAVECARAPFVYVLRESSDFPVVYRRAIAVLPFPIMLISNGAQLCLEERAAFFDPCRQLSWANLSGASQKEGERWQLAFSSSLWDRWLLLRAVLLGRWISGTTSSFERGAAEMLRVGALLERYMTPRRHGALGLLRSEWSRGTAEFVLQMREWQDGIIHQISTY